MNYVQPEISTQISQSKKTNSAKKTRDSTPHPWLPSIRSPSPPLRRTSQSMTSISADPTSRSFVTFPFLGWEEHEGRRVYRRRPRSSYSMKRFGIFPSLGLSQKLSRIIGGSKAREVSLTSMQLTAEVAEKLVIVNHVVEQGEAMKKSREMAEAIIKNEQGMVIRIKSIINAGLKLDLGHALTLEKERAHAYYCGMTKEQTIQEHAGVHS